MECRTKPPGFVGGVELSGLEIKSPSDMWVVGSQLVSAVRRTFTAHYGGNSWAVVPSPNMGTGDNALFDVSAVSSNDIWATGRYMYDTDHYLDRTLTMHWDGVQWSIVPNADTGYNRGSGAIQAISSNDVWIVGAGQQNTNDEPASMIMHWNGVAWSLVPIVNLGNGPNNLDDVSAVSSDDVWAVGMTTTLNPVHQETQIAHWDGTEWRIIPSVNPATDPHSGDYLWGVAAVPHTKAWAVGSYSYAATLGDATLHEHLNLMFTDILPGSTFFSNITCLACRGIVSGFSDGTFKPNNQVTRGQLSKIVSNAAGFSDPQPNQMFQDVPVGSTFQVYVGRLASRGYINGYPCGGAGEPCQPGNLPYFRPNNNATRGQISKIDANAAGFSDPPSGQQFEDVAVGSAFYTFTYRLVSRGVMSGYPCGGAGEPCVPPANLPYFRPNNNATRGQTSKIVANTFFPDCQGPH